MDNFISRLEVEQRDLNIKIDKLYLFIESDKYSGVDDTQQLLLRNQLDAMKTYAQILSYRIQLLSDDQVGDTA